MVYNLNVHIKDVEVYHFYPVELLLYWYYSIRNNILELY